MDILNGKCNLTAKLFLIKFHLQKKQNRLDNYEHMAGEIQTEGVNGFSISLRSYRNEMEQGRNSLLFKNS